MFDLANLPRMAVFAVIVREGSFTAAARVVGVSKASLSEHVRKLEASVGVRLLQRTTRRLSVTEAGEIYYRSCAQILDEAESANAALAVLQAEPTGTLRVTAPHSLGPSLVVPSIAEFSRLYPKVRLDLRFSDARVDLLEHEIDVAIRSGWPEESSLVSRKLAPMPQYLCASPAYLARAGRPTRLADLAEHLWVLLSGVSPQQSCTFQTPAGTWQRATPHGRTLTDSAAALHAFLLCGHGIGVLPAYMLEDDVKSGRLVRLLADHALPEGGVYALFPSRRQLSTKVARFIEILSEASSTATALAATRRPSRRSKA
jgi:DNA-binding transcriptional LysR family regulator